MPAPSLTGLSARSNGPSMLRRLTRQPVGVALRRRCFSSGLAQRAPSDPLRILFCGSDHFSCESLRALHREHEQDKSLIESLDVMVLSAKRSGRGFGELRQVPCRNLARELGLQIHQRDTFRYWELPEGTNLVVAVSFGLFVPPRILRSAKYGGLNVHPSFLPDLRGPAPIFRAMLRGDEHIGVSVQTLDEQEFDHGTVLAQTPAPGLFIRPDALEWQVTREAALTGAQMLVQALRDGLHVPPYRDVGWKAAELQGQELTHAPKVTKADAQIDWIGWRSFDDYRLRTRVFSAVWTQAMASYGVQQRRILVPFVEPLSRHDVRGTKGTVVFVQHGGRGPQDMSRHERNVVTDDETGACAVEIDDGVWVRMPRVKVAGEAEQVAATALRPYLRRADR